MKFVILYTVLLIAGNANAQQPITWNFSSKKIGENTFELHFSATIENSWHTYSQTTPAGGPAPTKISFAKNPLCQPVGKTREVGELENSYDEAFGVHVKSFSTKVDFVQVVKLKSGAKTNQSGTIEYMVCNSHECLPPKTISFSILINQ